MPKQALEAMTNVTPASEVSELKTEKPGGTRCLRSNTFAIAMIPSRNHSWIAITCSKFESEPFFDVYLQFMSHDVKELEPAFQKPALQDVAIRVSYMHTNS
jgi:hypothetical protein